MDIATATLKDGLQYNPDTHRVEYTLVVCTGRELRFRTPADDFMRMVCTVNEIRGRIVDYSPGNRMVLASTSYTFDNEFIMNRRKEYLTIKRNSLILPVGVAVKHLRYDIARCVINASVPYYLPPTREGERPGEATVSGDPADYKL